VPTFAIYTEVRNYDDASLQGYYSWQPLVDMHHRNCDPAAPSVSTLSQWQMPWTNGMEAGFAPIETQSECQLAMEGLKLRGDGLHATMQWMGTTDRSDAPAGCYVQQQNVCEGYKGYSQSGEGKCCDITGFHSGTCGPIYVYFNTNPGWSSWYWTQEADSKNDAYRLLCRRNSPPPSLPPSSPAPPIPPPSPPSPAPPTPPPSAPPSPPIPPHYPFDTADWSLVENGIWTNLLCGLFDMVDQCGCTSEQDCRERCARNANCGGFTFKDHAQPSFRRMYFYRSCSNYQIDFGDMSAVSYQ